MNKFLKHRSGEGMESDTDTSSGLWSGMELQFFLAPNYFVLRKLQNAKC